METENFMPPEFSTANETEELTPALQAVKDMELNYSSDEYNDAALDGRLNSQEVSVDAFLKLAKPMIEGNQADFNDWGAMIRILDRESMQDHPQLDVFKKAIQELADKQGHKLKVRKDFFENHENNEQGVNPW